MLAIATLLAALAAFVYTAVLFEVPPIGGWLAMAVLSWLALTAWAALTFVASTATGSTMAAAGIGFVALIGLSLASIVPAVDRLLPTGLTTPSMLLASGATATVDGGRLLTAVLGTLVIIGACLAVAVLAFRRREL